MLVGTIITLIIFIVVILIMALIFRRDFYECENSESPFCPQFTCPSSSITADPSSSTNYGNGIRAVRRVGNQLFHST